MQLQSDLVLPVVQSSIKVGGPQHEENNKRWQAILDRYAASLADASSEGKQSALTKHTMRGQLLGMSCPHHLIEKKEDN
jgi:hypothetical protein